MASYPMPAWLEGMNPGQFGQLAAGAAQRSQQMQIETARLNQQAQETRMRLEVQQQQQQQESLRQQQQAQIAASYHEAQLGIRKSELEQEQQRINLAVTGAARKFQAQRAYQEEAQALIASGLPQEQAYMQAALKHGPAAGVPASELSALSRMQPKTQAEVPPSVVTYDGQKFLKVPTQTGSRYQAMTDTEGRQLRMNKLQLMERQLQRLQTAHEKDSLGAAASASDAKSTAAVAARKRYADRQKQIDELNDQIDSALGGTETATSPSPKRDIPQPAIDHLKKNPDLREQFDQKYGEGAAEKVLEE